MSSKGWIKLHRELLDHWIFTEKRSFNRAEAWIYLLLEVNHKDREMLTGDKLEICKRGQTFTSKTKLSDEWNWSMTKVTNFLNLLEEQGMIKQEVTTKRTVVTIENYDKYQSQSKTEKEQEENKNKAEEKQEKTNKNDKELKNDKEVIYMSSDEARFIEILESVNKYPIDRETDIEFYKTLEERYPSLDLIECIKKWAVYKLDKPLKENSNARSQINNWCNNAVEWGKNKKKGGSNEDDRSARSGREQSGETGIQGFRPPS